MPKGKGTKGRKLSDITASQLEKLRRIEELEEGDSSVKQSSKTGDISVLDQSTLPHISIEQTPSFDKSAMSDFAILEELFEREHGKVDKEMSAMESLQYDNPPQKDSIPTEEKGENVGPVIVYSNPTPETKVSPPKDKGKGKETSSLLPQTITDVATGTVTATLVGHNYQPTKKAGESSKPRLKAPKLDEIYMSMAMEDILTTLQVLETKVEAVHSRISTIEKRLTILETQYLAREASKVTTPLGTAPLPVLNIPRSNLNVKSSRPVQSVTKTFNTSFNEESSVLTAKRKLRKGL